MRSTALLPPDIAPYPYAFREKGYYTTNNSKTDYNFEHDGEMWDESSRSAHWRNRPDPDQPFFAIFNFNTTHESRIARDETYAEATANLPDSLFHNPEFLTLPPYYPDTPAVREQWTRYYNIISAMDRQVGDVLRQLREDGLEKETIVFFYSDHGVGLPRGKRWLYDSGLHVPLMIHFPEAYRDLAPANPGEVTDRLVSFIDFPVTAMSLAGIEPPAYMQGSPFLGAFADVPRPYVYAARDRMDERYDMIRAVRDKRYKYIRNYEPYKPYFQYMNTPEKGLIMQALRSAEAKGTLPLAAQKYFAREKPEEELYDVEIDPHELNNLVHEPAYVATLNRLRQAHRDWMADIHDVGLLPESYIHTLQQERGTSIYKLVREQPEILEEALTALIDLSVDRGKSEADFSAGLNKSSPAARYWSANRHGHPEACIGTGDTRVGSFPF